MNGVTRLLMKTSAALLEETECLSPATAMGVLETKIKKVDLLEIDRQALAAGRNFIDGQVRVWRSPSTRRLRVLSTPRETGRRHPRAFLVVRHPDQSPGASHYSCT
jgi:hypothetical protein